MKAPGRACKLRRLARGGLSVPQVTRRGWHQAALGRTSSGSGKALCWAARRGYGIRGLAGAASPGEVAAAPIDRVPLVNGPGRRGDAGSVHLAGQIPASTLLKCCKLRIVLVHRVIGLPGCWVAVMSIIFLCG